MTRILSVEAGKRGADLLKVLSDVLNDAGLDDQVDVSAAVTALDGIYLLCRESVIDVATAVKVLSPKLRGCPANAAVAAKFLPLLRYGTYCCEF